MGRKNSPGTPPLTCSKRALRLSRYEEGNALVKCVRALQTVVSCKHVQEISMQVSTL